MKLGTTEKNAGWKTHSKSLKDVYVYKFIMLGRVSELTSLVIVPKYMALITLRKAPARNKKLILPLNKASSSLEIHQTYL